MLKPSLLIIDDKPLSFILTKQYLIDSGYKVTIAERGNQAWQLLSQQPEAFSVIILNRALPDIDGLLLLSTIKHHPALQTIPVIMLATSMEKKEIISAFRSGIYDFLTKPIENELLAMVIKRAVRDSRPLVVC